MMKIMKPTARIATQAILFIFLASASTIVLATDIEDIVSDLPIASIIKGIDSCARSAVGVASASRDDFKSNDDDDDKLDSGTVKIKRELIEVDFSFEDMEFGSESSSSESAGLMRSYGLNTSPETQELRLEPASVTEFEGSGPLRPVFRYTVRVNVRDFVPRWCVLHVIHSCFYK